MGPSSLQKLLPSWIGIVQRLEDAPHGAVVLLDEAYMTYHARGSMTADGRTIGQAVNLSRQRGQTLIFVVQELRQLDVNDVSQADVLAIKELSEISREFERKELRKVTDRARAAFAATPVQDKRGLTWIHSEPTAFQGLTRNEMPSFMTHGIPDGYRGRDSIKRTPKSPFPKKQRLQRLESALPA